MQMQILKNLNDRIVDGIKKALRLLAPKSLHDLLHICITPCLDHRDLRRGHRRVSSYWRDKAMAESYDPTPTHSSDGPEPSLEVKQGLRGWILIVPQYEILYVICLYNLKIY